MVSSHFSRPVHFVFRHLPLESHSQAFAAARAAYCAGEQGRFWQYHDPLFTREDHAPGVQNHRDGIESARKESTP